jgi:hypothetical protein
MRKAFLIAMRDGKVVWDKTFHATEYDSEKTVFNGQFHPQIFGSEAGVVSVSIASLQTH